MLSVIKILLSLIAPTLRLATPLIFAGIGGVFCENSGVVNIGLEGMMTVGAFFAVVGSYFTHNPWIGVLFAAVGGALIALLHAFLSINLKADQVISGTAINLFSTAICSFLIIKIFKKGGQTDIVNMVQFPSFIKNIPLIGGFLNQLNWFVILALILVAVAYFVLYKTPTGLRIRAVGEYPKAADTLGINVYKTRYVCVILSGIFAAIGGAALSVGISAVFKEGMVSGRGYIALAALIFGNWKPTGTLGACLLFGFAEAFQMRAQNFGWNLPQEFYSCLPYLITMLALAGFVGKTQAPASDGVPYEKGER